MKSKSNEAKVPAMGDLMADVHTAAEFKARASRDPTGLGAMTQAQWCARYHVSRTALWKLRKAGIAPDVILAGHKVLITYQAAAEWEARMIARSRNAVEEEAA
ncbi:hypothetical protein [Paraburkholderia guartelaensis]|uniref:DNA-binding protein n=1 Tax=Paraburkholderia guartelaensis TaxID=2546446 RepID=A0ABU9SJK3_9BURK